MFSLGNLLVPLVVGILVGAIAGKIMDKDFSVLGCLIVGVVGGYIGSFVLKVLHINISGTSNLSNLVITILIDVMGAYLLLKVVDLAKKKK